ncbi:hypothetical protein KIK06_23570 [Nocardiopsis sp. EMB25]|uniref:hypothetical protein n=1 Tax=Nocardiopsis TaxID=2013 RepID=UPI0003720708|nr:MULTISPECIES: hypothetical protein [Nocardiopsis]MCY9786866.1 hypothetical protein [Nocardiopsis sp. EMB25]
MTLSIGLSLTACGGGSAEEEQPPADPNAEAATRLQEAQPTSVRDATLLPEGSESGTYSELATVQYSEQVRESTEIDKPECVDAANRWGDLDGVRGAPASVAAYEWPEGSVSSMLVEVDEETAVEAMAVEPPGSCESYNATYADGTSSEYGVRDLDMPEMGDGSRAFLIEVRTGEEESRMLSVMYRNGTLLGMTSILGGGDEADYEEMLTAFTEAAIDRQDQMLG